MKAKNINLNWLPRGEEWDCGLVAPEECRVACHWEYARHELPPMSKPGDQYVFCPHNYRQAAREHFPAPWLSLTKAQREKILESFYPAPVMQVRTLREFFKRMPTNGSHPEILQALLRHSYVIIPNFRVHGVEAVIKEFEKWARKEAKQHPQSRRAQAAEPPFDALKWLAVARLDKARSKAKVTIEQA